VETQKQNRRKDARLWARCSHKHVAWGSKNITKSQKFITGKYLSVVLSPLCFSGKTNPLCFKLKYIPDMNSCNVTDHHRFGFLY